MLRRINIKKILLAGNVAGQYNKATRLVSSYPANFSQQKSTIEGKGQKITTSKQDFVQLMAVWPEIKEDLFSFTRKFDKLDTGTEYYNKMLDHNIPEGHILFAILSLHAYKRLVDNPSAADLKLAMAHSWFCEMFMGGFNIIDDIGDQGKERRGRPCWHTLEDVGLRAPNDSSLILTGAYRFLRKHFGDKDCYSHMAAIWNEAEHTTAYGMSLEYTLGKKNVLSFTESDMWAVWHCKVQFFYSTVASSMAMAGITDPELFRRVWHIATEIGWMFQIHNDFQDVYADEFEVGKLPTDIQENKLTWFAVQTNKQGNERQREILNRCYGSHDPDKVAEVRNVYNELGLFEAILKFEEETYQGVLEKMQNLGRLEDVFHKLILIYKNDKSKLLNSYAPPNHNYKP